MRLVTFLAGEQTPRFGVWHDDTIIDPHAVLYADARLRGGDAESAELRSVPQEMVAFFESGDRGRAVAQRAIEVVTSRHGAGDELIGPSGEAGVVNRADARLLAPVPRPRRIRDYLTYTQHAAGSGLAVPEAFTAMPICYKCNIETVIGTEEPLLWPGYADQLDFELELGFFTSGHGRNLTTDEASGLIAGVTIFNDVSARDIQMFEMSMTIGPSKGKDFCTAMGPCVLTMDEVDEWAITMTARINGETWASGTTQHRQFSFAEVLAWASLSEDVYAGEFLALGTVGGGCGLELDRWIQPGDVVELEASGIGTLRNTVGEKEIYPPGVGLSSYKGSPPVHVNH